MTLRWEASSGSYQWLSIHTSGSTRLAPSVSWVLDHHWYKWMKYFIDVSKPRMKWRWSQCSAFSTSSLTYLFVRMVHEGMAHCTCFPESWQSQGLSTLQAQNLKKRTDFFFSGFEYMPPVQFTLSDPEQWIKWSLDCILVIKTLYASKITQTSY